MAFSVQGKTALITGAGSGICLELAKLLLHKQCNVLIADLQLSPEAAELVRTEARVAFIKTDVSDWGQLNASFEAAIEKFGGVDIVVPGAGVFEPEWSSFWHPSLSSSTPATSKSTFATLEINLTHPIKATQLAISHFQTAQKPGTVVLISSIAAQMPLFPYPLYACSKAAISSFVRSMGPLEELLGVRVMGVAPGIVRTPIWNEEKLSLVEEGVDTWVSAQRVAETIISVIEEAKWDAGTVVEVGVEELRVVKGVDDEGPLGKGCIVTGDPTVAVGAALKGVKEEFVKSN